MITASELHKSVARTTDRIERELIPVQDFLPVPGRTVALVLKDGRIRKGRLFVGQTYMEWQSYTMGNGGGESGIKFEDVLSWLG